jgi:hypothetical protein
MARGITQDQVNEAADTLLRAGERPTIERVRAALRTGSPNTLIRLLDVWWAALGERLAQQERRLAVPEAPAAFGEAAGALWRLAIEHAEKIATAAYASAQEELERSRQANDIAVRDAQARVQDAVDRAQSAEIQRDATLARMADLDRLVEAQATQLEEIAGQRRDALARGEELQTSVSHLTAELRQLTHDAAAERERRDAHSRAQEDRWLQEVDRARQETARHLAALQRREEQLRNTTGELERIRRAYLDAERQLAGMIASHQAAVAENARLHQLFTTNTRPPSSQAPKTRKPVIRARSPKQSR